MNFANYLFLPSLNQHSQIWGFGSYYFTHSALLALNARKFTNQATVLCVEYMQDLKSLILGKRFNICAGPTVVVRITLEEKC